MGTGIGSQLTSVDVVELVLAVVHFGSVSGWAALEPVLYISGPAALATWLQPEPVLT